MTTATTDPARRLLSPAIARIRRTDDVPVGAGVLVLDGYVLTCAHIVDAAVGRSLDPADALRVAVPLDFVLANKGQVVEAYVVAWVPIADDESGDVALLRLRGEPPPHARGARIVVSADLFGHPFSTYGFPAGYPHGVWSTGRLLREQGSHWWQLEDTKDTGIRVEPGFSGAPVWDEALRGVVGILATHDRPAQTRTAFMLPIGEILGLLPGHRHLLVPPPAPEREGVDLSLDDITRRSPGRRSRWRSWIDGS